VNSYNPTARYWHEREFETVEALRDVAAEAGMSMATMALPWVLANPAVTAPIIGASKPEQLADSLAAVDTVMSAELKARLDEVTKGWRAVDAERWLGVLQGVSLCPIRATMGS
jgi:aryl-alcohol dehydrogenase (NADP+)